MMDFLYLIPVALILGLAGLLAFMWSLRSGQYDDLDGAAERILFDDDSPLKVMGQEDHHDLTVENSGARPNS
jgi:cbb3-type cytochrome oxidase maturation protein